MRAALTLGLLVLAACWEHDPPPRYAQLGPSGGYAPDDFDFEGACRGGWEYGSADPDAKKHVSFPELDPAGCFVPVVYDKASDKIVELGAIPDGCGFPTRETGRRLQDRAKVYQRVADVSPLGRGTPVPFEIACTLPDRVRREAARANARTMAAYAEPAADEERRYPYGAAGTFGYGSSDQNTSVLVGWVPSEPCRAMDDAGVQLLGVNDVRARRIAAAYHAGVAPFVTVSGGAIHGIVVEAFMLGHLAHCRYGVPIDRILFDPCADHTHTNVRNTGALVQSIGARTAYVITDDFLQSKYLQEWTSFDLMGGSIDQRSLRDFGYLVGSWRQASRGIEAGFWFTPYRFWAEPTGGRGSFTCVGDVPYAP